MRAWQSVLAMASPPLLIGSLAYLEDIVGRVPLENTTWPAVTCVVALIGHSGIVFAPTRSKWLAPSGLVYSAACPLAMVFAGLMGSCAAGDCI